MEEQHFVAGIMWKFRDATTNSKVRAQLTGDGINTGIARLRMCCTDDGMRLIQKTALSQSGLESLRNEISVYKLLTDDKRSQFNTEHDGADPTGFLGAYLVNDLLKNKEKIYCLVRCKHEEIGLKRIRENMEKYKLWKFDYQDRLIIVPGDLQLEFFGLSIENYNILCKTIDVIYHNAAMVNYITNYNSHRLTNVIGTFNIIKLAISIKLKKINFVSTIAVFGPYFYFTGSDLINEHTCLDTSITALKYDMGYSQSKWVAEKLLLSFLT